MGYLLSLGVLIVETDTGVYLYSGGAVVNETVPTGLTPIVMIWVR